MVKGSGGRTTGRWKDMPRAEKYALLQNQVLFWALFAVALSLLARQFGVGTVVLMFAGGVLCTGAATTIGRRRRRNRTR